MPGQPLTPHQSQSPLLAPAGCSALPSSEVCLHYCLPLLTLAAFSSLCITIFSGIYLIYLIFIPSVRSSGCSANRSAVAVLPALQIPWPLARLLQRLLFICCCSWPLTHVLSQMHQECARPPKGLFQGELTEPRACNIAERGLSDFAFSM